MSNQVFPIPLIYLAGFSTGEAAKVIDERHERLGLRYIPNTEAHPKALFGLDDGRTGGYSLLHHAVRVAREVPELISDVFVMGPEAVFRDKLSRGNYPFPNCHFIDSNGNLAEKVNHIRYKFPGQIVVISAIDAPYVTAGDLSEYLKSIESQIANDDLVIQVVGFKGGEFPDTFPEEDRSKPSYLVRGPDSDLYRLVMGSIFVGKVDKRTESIDKAANFFYENMKNEQVLTKVLKSAKAVLSSKGVVKTLSVTRSAIYYLSLLGFHRLAVSDVEDFVNKHANIKGTIGLTENPNFARDVDFQGDEEKDALEYLAEQNSRLLSLTK